MLRGSLWAGDRSFYIEARVTGTHGSNSSVVLAPPSARPAKIDARYLGPYLQHLDAAVRFAAA